MPPESVSPPATGALAKPTDAAERTKARARAVRRRALLVNGTRLVVLVLFLGLWEWFSRAGVIDKFNFSMPSEVYDQIRTWVMHGTAQGSLGAQIWATLQEALYGWVIGVAAGVLLGIALGRVRFLADVFGPYVKILNAMPRIVLAPIFLIWFGLGPASKIASAVVLVFFPVFFNAFQGAREVDRNLVANARILGASNRQVTFQVVIPSATSWIFTSLHVSFGFALIGAVVGELLGADKGMGLLIRNAQNNFSPNGVLAGMVVIGVIALIAEALITALEKRLLRWRPPQMAGDAGI